MLTTSYPVRAGSVSGSFVRDLLLALRPSGWRFEVVTPRAAGRGGGLHDAGIRVSEARHWGDHWSGGLAHLRGIPETLASEPWKWMLAPSLTAALDARARATLATRSVDLIWSHWLFPSGLIGARIAGSRRVPHLATAHGADVHLLERLVRLPGIRQLLRAAWADTRIVAPAAHTAHRVSAALGGREVGVCPLPVAVAPCIGERPGSPDSSPRLLFLGRFEPVKGPDLLLEACARIASGRVREIALAGSGSLEPGLRARAACLAHPTRFPGVLDSGDKARAFARADALVIPSRRMADGRTEGFPHAAMEALACGRPVIAPDEGALGAWLARSGAGLAFDPGRCDAERVRGLAGALLRFASEPALREALSLKARAAGLEFRAGSAVARWSEQLIPAGSGAR